MQHPEGTEGRRRCERGGVVSGQSFNSSSDQKNVTQKEDRHPVSLGVGPVPGRAPGPAGGILGRSPGVEATVVSVA
jgi:hypothetical protein